MADARVQGTTSDGTWFTLRVNTSGQVVLAPLPGDDTTNNVRVVEIGRNDWQVVSGGGTNVQLGAAGAAGDYLDHFVVQTFGTASNAWAIMDGTATVFSATAGFLASGFLDIPVRAPCTATTGWKVTANNNVYITAFGRFT